MPNVNYRAGVRFEREVKKRYEQEGKMVTRTAGSHGAYDLVASAPEGRVWFTQCKRVQTKAQAKRLIENMKAHPFMDKGEHYLRRIEVYVVATRERLGAFL